MAHRRTKIRKRRTPHRPIARVQRRTDLRRDRRPFEVAPAPAKRLQITDVVLRDGHQSLLATRMRTEDMLPIAQRLDAIGYWSLEVWGGATFDTCLRFLKEDPWERLRALRGVLPNTRLQMLLRGQNIVGYRHYADDIVDRFVERSAANGIDVFRIFDALNDVRNLERSMRAVKGTGKHAQPAICYTVSPVHNVDKFVELAKQLEDLGADTLCIKDMAGLLAPMAAYHLVKRLKAAVRVPIHLHTHYTSGMASMSSLMAILGGLDILDTSISPFAGGTSHPPTETLVAALRGSPYDTGLELPSFIPIADHFRDVRKKYHQFESDFNGVDAEILSSQIPGGMLSNLAAQLAEQNALDKMKQVMEEVPRVRADMGYPPLVTPSSQIVGTQATLNVLTGERYKVITNETKNYFLGLYGRPPGPVDQQVMARAIGDEEPVKGRPADRLDPEFEKAKKEIAGKGGSTEDVLSFALFPPLRGNSSRSARAAISSPRSSCPRRKKDRRSRMSSISPPSSSTSRFTERPTIFRCQDPAGRRVARSRITSGSTTSWKRSNSRRSKRCSPASRRHRTREPRAALNGPAQANRVTSPLRCRAAW
jgi:pyruvate carboxylase subunit B